MPFKSKSQMKAAFGGYLGPEMKKKADTWAHETPNISKLPSHVSSPGRGLGKEGYSHSGNGSHFKKGKVKDYE